MTNADHFNDKAEVYHQYRQGFPIEVVEAIVEITSLPQTAQVLDVGAGTGLWSKTLIQHFQYVTALDPNPHMLAIAQEHLPNLKSTHMAPAEDTNLPDQSFDLITAARVFHWLDQPKAKSEWSRLLTPPKWVAILSSSRAPDQDELYNARSEAVTAVSPIFAELSRSNKERNAEATTFLNNPVQQTIPYTESLSFDQFLGREKSKAYFPINDPTQTARLTGALHEVFNQFAESGMVNLTEAYKVTIGTLP